MAGEPIKFGGFLIAFGLSIAINSIDARAVNISNTWTLPQEGYSVFYRYFRDKISWFEADAVCQFHHANLVTVSNGIEFDASRAFLKELDVSAQVWIGLMRPQTSPRFSWSNGKPLDPAVSYWGESIPILEAPLCAVVDPLRDYRWHALRCGGPETAAFLCEMEVPSWASECTFNAMPSVTVQYMSDTGTIQLSRDCGEEGTRHISCRGKSDRERILKELICTDDNIPIAPVDNTLIESTTTSENKKVRDHARHLESDSSEINQIEQNRISDENKHSLEDMMMGDQPTVNEDFEKKRKEKKMDDMPEKKKLKKTLSDDKLSEEMMMGDQSVHLPLYQISSDVESLKTETTQSPSTTDVNKPTSTIDSQSTTISPAKTSEWDSESSTMTTIMVSSTTDPRLRRQSNIESSTSTTESSTSVELSSTTIENLSTTVETVVDQSELVTEKPFVPSGLHEDGRKSGGHPIHIPKLILMQNDKISTVSTPTFRPTLRRDLSDEHFIPPMLLVKSQFTTKTHEMLHRESTSAVNIPSTTSETIIDASDNSDSAFIIDENPEAPEIMEKITAINNHTPTDFEISEATSVGGGATGPVIHTLNETASSEIHTSVLSATTNAANESDLDKNIYIDNEMDATHHPHHDHSHHEHDHEHEHDLEHDLSNAENFQPYRPNRHRKLTKPDNPSFIKKITG